MLSRISGLASWRFAGGLVLALTATAIVHLVWTLAMPSLAPASGAARLMAALPVNKAIVLEPVTPQRQPLPFMSAERRYAVCGYETELGPVRISASLPAPGWALALYAGDGDNFYLLTGNPPQTLSIALLLVPPGDRSVGALAVARSQLGNLPELALTRTAGLAVVHAPAGARVDEARTLAGLAAFDCAQIRSTGTQPVRR